MEETKTQFLKSFVFVKTQNSARIICNGNLEFFDCYSNLPKHIRGIIKYQGRMIPVLDFSVQFENLLTEIDSNCCLLIIKHNSVSNQKTLYSAVLIEDFDEIIKLSQNFFPETSLKNLKINSRYLVKLASGLNTELILENNHNLLFKYCNSNLSVKYNIENTKFNLPQQMK